MFANMFANIFPSYNSVYHTMKRICHCDCGAYAGSKECGANIYCIKCTKSKTCQKIQEDIARDYLTATRYDNITDKCVCPCKENNEPCMGELYVNVCSYCVNKPTNLCVDPKYYDDR